MVDEWQWNIINPQRKHKTVEEKGMEKCKLERSVSILHSYFPLYNLQHISVLLRKMEAQKWILFHHEMLIVNWSFLHENRVTYIRNCVQSNDPRPSIKNTSLLFKPPPTQFQNAHC